MKLPDLIPNSYIYVSVRNLYIPSIGLPFGCRKIGRPILGINKSLKIHECGNWGTELYKSVLYK